MIHLPIHKPNDPKCGCVTGHYECGTCRNKKLKSIYARMTPEQQAYDRMVDPKGAYSFVPDRDDPDMEYSCSCHICAPCGVCTSKSEEEDN